MFNTIKGGFNVSLLTKTDVDHLLAILKTLVPNPANIKVPNKGDKDFKNAQSTINVRDRFTIQVYRSKKDIHKMNFSVRYNPNNQMLLRLDSGDIEHTNPDGMKIIGTHVHFYKDGYETSFAYEIHFDDKSSIWLYEHFLELINVVAYNEIVEISELDLNI